MQKTYNELMKRESSVGIIYEFLPINPIKHNELIMKAVNLFGETGVHIILGKIATGGNEILQTGYFVQAMQQLCRVAPVKLSEFQIELLSHVRRSDLNLPSDQGTMLTTESLLGLSEFSLMPGGDKKDPIILLNKLTVSALEEYIVPFVSMLSENDMFKTLIASLTTWLGDTARTSTGSSGDQSMPDSSPQEAIKETRKKRESKSGIFTKQGK